MLMQSRPTARSLGQVVEDLAGDSRMSGGSRDSDVNDWMVSPIGFPCHMPVAMATPLAKWPRTLRKCAWKPASELPEITIPRGYPLPPLHRLLARRVLSGVELVEPGGHALVVLA
jgi:hypothetical protein